MTIRDMFVKNDADTAEAKIVPKAEALPEPGVYKSNVSQVIVEKVVRRAIKSDVEPSIQEKDPIDIQINTLIEAFNHHKPSIEYTRKKLSELANRLLPPNEPLPETPTVLWSSAKAEEYENPAKFTEDIYKKWFATELSWPYLYKIDRPLYNALRYYLKKNQIELDSYLPTKTSLVRRDLEQAGPEGIRKATRLHRAAQRNL